MSIEAINWALTTAPIPRDRKDASSLAVVLIGLANHADPEGRNAFLSIPRLAGYTRLSPRSVQYALKSLTELGLITPSDPEIVAAHVKRADRRPNGWDLAIHKVAVDNPKVIHNGVDDGVQAVHPAGGHGVQTRPDGVQTTTARGAKPAPEPSLNHPGTTRPRAPADTRASTPLPPVCATCDARPGEPAAARIRWLDNGRFELCPACNPTAPGYRHPPAAEPP